MISFFFQINKTKNNKFYAFSGKKKTVKLTHEKKGKKIRSILEIAMNKLP